MISYKDNALLPKRVGYRSREAASHGVQNYAYPHANALSGAQHGERTPYGTVPARAPPTRTSLHLFYRNRAKDKTEFLEKTNVFI